MDEDYYDQIEEIEDRISTLRSKMGDQIDQRTEALRVQIREIETRIKKEYAPQFLALEEKRNGLEKTRIEKRIKEAEKDTYKGRTPGTLFEEYVPRTFNRNELVSSGRLAELQIFRPEDPLPHNMASYNRPSPGDLVLRVFRKDGSPSKVVLGTWSFKKSSWIPKGDDPEAHGLKVRKG